MVVAYVAAVAPELSESLAKFVIEDLFLLLQDFITNVSCQTIFQLLHPLNTNTPLLPLSTPHTPPQRQPTPLHRPHPRDPVNRLLDPYNPVLPHHLLRRAHRIL